MLIRTPLDKRGIVVLQQNPRWYQEGLQVWRTKEEQVRSAGVAAVAVDWYNAIYIKDHVPQSNLDSLWKLHYEGYQVHLRSFCGHERSLEVGEKAAACCCCCCCCCSCCGWCCCSCSRSRSRRPWGAIWSQKTRTYRSRPQKIFSRPYPECALLKRFNRFIGLEVHCWNASFIEINQQELLFWQLKICCIFQHRSVEIFNRISWFSRQKHQFLHVSKTKNKTPELSFSTCVNT